jgi:hypothetical protein
LLKRFKAFLNPLRIFSATALLGDVALLLSGGYFLNPLRMSVAVLGFGTHAVGLFYGSHRTMSILGRPVTASDFVMGVVCVCGVLDVLSGSNLFGFERAPRYTEMILGVCITAAGLCSLYNRFNFAMVFFSIGPLLHLVQAFEVQATQGRLDPFQLMAGVCFLASSIASRSIRKDKRKQAAIL